jgi:predicted alpha/beta hydrolase
MQQGHPLAFISKSLGPRTKGLSTYEKEYLAILVVVDHWSAFFQLTEFVIVIDQKNLTHLSDQRLNTYWQQKIFSKLIGLQNRIVYQKGTYNRVVDALSRHPSAPA